MNLEKITDYQWKIPKTGGMRVPGTVYATRELLEMMKGDKALEQTRNVAHLPGIIKHSIVLPDGHLGYGFPIGGVAALDAEEGCISPGGVGFDINCGVRLVRTNLDRKDLDMSAVKRLINQIFKNVPSGLGSKGKINVNDQEINKVLSQGVKWAVNNGYGWEEDLEHVESNGCIEPNDPNKVSRKAKNRGKPQIGSLGSGNHFVEIEYVSKIDDEPTAEAFDLKEGQVCVLIHTGSRGLGHQVCSEYIRKLEKAFPNKVKSLPDRQLVYAPTSTKEFDDYFKAMNCAANYAFTNRQLITHWVRQSFEQALNKNAKELGMSVVYDIAHNMAKKEEHEINGEKKTVIVHRKGATRAFPKGHEDVPEAYKSVGHPVFIPGNMGVGSCVMVGLPEAMSKSWGSCAHGSGRTMSRTESKRRFRADTVKQQLMKQGVYVKGASKKGISEESPGSYKDLKEVVKAVKGAGVAKPVAWLKPLGVIKG